MGAILYPPKGVNYEEWLCDLMCGTAETDYEEDNDDRTEQVTAENTEHD